MKRRAFIKSALAFSPLLIGCHPPRGRTTPPNARATPKHFVRNRRYASVLVGEISSLSPGASFAEDAVILRRHLEETLNRGARRVRIRSGGLSYIGASVAPGAHVVDLSSFRRVEVDEQRRTVRVGGGTSLAVMNERLAAISPTIFLPTGDCPTVGVAGYLSGGGQSELSSILGLGVDRVLEATLLVVRRVRSRYRCEALRIAPDENADVFWAAMGGGAQFGVLCDLTLRFESLEGYSLYRIFVDKGVGPSLSEIFARWEALCDRDLGEDASSKLQADNGGGAGISGVARAPSDLAALEKLSSSIGGSFERQPLTLENMYVSLAGCKTLSTCATTAWTAGSEFFSARSLLLPRTDPAGRNLDEVQRRLVTMSRAEYAYVQLQRWSGAMSRPNPHVSFPFRNAAYECQVYARTHDAKAWSETGGFDAWVDETAALIGPREAAFFNHVSRDVATNKALYFGDAWPRLEIVKRKCDPERIFDPFSAGDAA